MKVNNKHYRTVWMEDSSVFMIDQNFLPFEFKIYESKNYMQTCKAIKNMTVRGAGAIGATAGYAMAQAFLEVGKKNKGLQFLEKAINDIQSTRPTAQNLFYATNRVFESTINSVDSRKTAIEEAQKIAEEDIEACKKIGTYGVDLIKNGMNMETHCNAGWLAFVDYGTALSPIYMAKKQGKQFFVYVDETRPRSQGARLTAWELKNEDIPHKIIPDNAGAYLMSKGKIDMMIVGADRIALNGDVANKIGTLEKAIVAKEYNVPFYVATPTSTFDKEKSNGDTIKIETRSDEEILYQTGLTEQGKLEKVLVCNPGSKGLNVAFDVTPAKFITGIITEKGIIKPNQDSISKFFPLTNT